MGDEASRPLSWLDSAVGEGLISGAVDTLAAYSTLALDTEADSFYRYFERVCLLQVSTVGDDFLFDPLDLGLPEGLRGLLSDPSRTWVLHGGDFDVLSLRRDFDLEIGRLFDTMVAARFLGLPGVGLAAVLESELGVSVSKTSQRSDWGRRPLTEQQISYARQDTASLLPLAEVLRVQLIAANRLHWVEEECELLRQRVPTPKVFDRDGWRKIKGVTSLSEIGQRASRAAYMWRDEVAKRKNRAPFRVMGNDGLYAIGAAVDRDGPDAARRVDRVRGVSKGLDVRALSRAVQAGVGSDDPLASRPRGGNDNGRRRPNLDASSKARLNTLKRVRDSTARALALEPGLLLPTALAESIARDHPRDRHALSGVQGMTNWRVEAFATQVLEALA